MIKNLFSSLTKKAKIRETEYFQVLLVIFYVFVIIMLLPVGQAVFKFILEVVLFLIYFLPFFIANIKKYPSEKKIFWLNLLLGWTIVIWLILIAILIDYKEKPKKKKI